MNHYDERLLGRYSDKFVESSDPEVRRLFWLLTLFFAKCDGVLSNSEVRKLTGDQGAIPFDPFQTPPERRDSIETRLKFLKKYRIKSPQEIIRVATWGFFTTEKINPSDRKYLIEFVDNPGKTFSWFAQKLEVKVSSVFEAYHRLRDKIHFRFNAALNYTLFKLKHFILFFRPNEKFTSQALSRDFTLSINQDTFGEWMWTSFLIPSQARIIREFADGLKRLSLESFEDHELHEIRSMARSCNLSMFDGDKWIHSEDVIGVGAFSFAEREREVTPRLAELQYAEEPSKFTAVDYIAACLKSANARIKNSEIRKVLAEYGYNLAWVTLSKRLASLRKEGFFLPSFGFVGLGLNVAMTFAVECDTDLVETLYHVFPQFPHCTASRTNKGVVFMIRCTSESAPAISYLMQSTLQEKADRLIVANRLQNIGIRSPMGLHSHWNSEKQYWEFERGHFDLSRRLA